MKKWWQTLSSCHLLSRKSIWSCSQLMPYGKTKTLATCPFDLTVTMKTLHLQFYNKTYKHRTLQSGDSWWEDPTWCLITKWKHYIFISITSISIMFWVRESHPQSHMSFWSCGYVNSRDKLKTLFHTSARPISITLATVVS